MKTGTKTTTTATFRRRRRRQIPDDLLIPVSSLSHPGTDHSIHDNCVIRHTHHFLACSSCPGLDYDRRPMIEEQLRATVEFVVIREKEELNEM